jgi:hypothetical protein
MLKHSLLIFLVTIFSVSLVSGQIIDLSAGISYENYLKVQDNRDVYSTDFNHDIGYNLSVTGTLFKIYNYPILSSVRFDHYHVDLYTGSDNNALGGYSYTQADVSRDIIGMAVYPLNFNFRKILHINFGPEGSVRLHSKTDGKRVSQMMGQKGHTYHIENDSMKINLDYFAGITMNVGYFFPLSDKYDLSTRLRVYYGLTDEFKNLQSQLRMVRFSLEMGVARKQHKKNPKI